MTNRKRNITPGKGDIYTFMDCPVWIGKFNGHIDGRDHCLNHFMQCHNVIAAGQCRRGFRR